MFSINTEQLTKRYPNGNGISGVGLRVPAGSIYGFLGSNGAGKTTTIRALLGLLKPDAGRIEILGNRMPRGFSKVLPKLGVVPGDIHLYEELTGQQLLDYFQGFLKCKPLKREELVDSFSLSGNDLRMKIRNYSHGMKQKLLLIQAMQHDPDLLILDEPSERLDPLHQQVLYEHLQAFKQKGKTIFFSSHNLPEVEKICDHVGIIKDGKLLIQEEVKRLKEQIPRTIEIWFESGYEPGHFNHDMITIIESDESYLKFEWKGDIRELVRLCHLYAIREIIIPAPSMEKLFMSYYQMEKGE